MKRGLLSALLLAVVASAVWLLLLRRGAAPSSSPARPNILLVTIDTLRADRAGGALTPHLNRLAGRGVAFSTVRATVPLTLPSHVSLMTGTIPPVHGVRENGVLFDGKRPTLARILKDADYRTGGFVGAYVLNRRFGLADGFDHYDDAVRRDPGGTERLEAERPGAEVVDAAVAWLNASAPQRSSSPAQPFFLWVHLYDPHVPYAPPQEFLQKAGGLPYDGEVAYADAQLGRLVDALASGGLLESTIVAVTGDHGESLGEHGEQTHGMLLYEGALRVPLVMAGPAVTPTASPPCHSDLAPALLRLAGLGDRVPPSMTGGVFRADPDRTGAPADCAAYAESRYPRRAGWHALTALADSRWKLVSSSEQELYDLSTDPGERTNVAASQPTVVQAMAAMLSKMQPAGQPTSSIAPEAAERLRALGYVGGSSAITSDDPGAPNPAAVIGAWTEFEAALGLLQASRSGEAIAILRPLTARFPGAPVFQSTYARALREAGDPRAAVAVYKAAVARWPADAALFHDLGVAAREAGDQDEAIRAERAALALDSTSAMAHNGLGLLHADAGRFEEAAAEFERAAQQDPTNVSYWTNLGNARQARKDGTGAESAYRRALAVDADFGDALNGLGTLYVQGGRAADAVPFFERALRRDPNLHEARLNLGIAYQESGQRERAAATYRQLLATAPPTAARERAAAAELLKSLQ